jgi:hypothetical protein
MRSVQLAEALTASEPISTTLEDGSIVEGTLGFHPSGKGRFKVSYAGKSIMGMRSDIGVEYMRPGAMILLRQMAAINKHVTVDADKVRLKIKRGEMVSLLEIDIEIPTHEKQNPERYAPAVQFH